LASDRDSKDQIQAAGGSLVTVGWTAVNPLFLPFGQKCKRIPHPKNTSP